MAMIIKDGFAPMKQPLLGVTAIDASADAIAIKGDSITFINVSGNIWINPFATAVADVTALKLTAGQSIDLVVKENLSIISDGSGGTYQIVRWDV